MNVIVAVDKNWGIGYQNKLLVSIPEDMKFFREMTSKKVIIMGRNTLESFPDKKALKNRTNIVVTLETGYEAEGAIVLSGIDEVLEEVKKYNTEDVFVIGGASIYSQLLPYCDVAYVTKVNYRYDADAFFPNIDEMQDWEIESVSADKTHFNLGYAFYKYKKKK